MIVDCDLCGGPIEFDVEGVVSDDGRVMVRPVVDEPHYCPEPDGESEMEVAA